MVLGITQHLVAKLSLLSLMILAFLERDLVDMYSVSISGLYYTCILRDIEVLFIIY